MQFKKRGTPSMRGRRRGQSAVEFVVLFAALMFFFVGFFAVIQENIQRKNYDKQNSLLQSTALNIRDEINLAAESSDGYYREFYVPGNILGQDYTVSVSDGFVQVSMPRAGYTFKVFNITGQIQKGNNNITKQNGQVFLN